MTNSDEITVTIVVTGVDEAPDITGEASVSFVENDNITTAVGITVTTWRMTRRRILLQPLRWRGPTEASSTSMPITNGESYVQGRARLREAGDANKDNVYEVTVEATDAVGNTGTKDVKVTVTNVEEDGTVTMSQLQPRVGVAITASVTDPDGDVSGVTWQWSTAPCDT